MRHGKPTPVSRQLFRSTSTQIALTVLVLVLGLTVLTIIGMR